jgi:REP element-mobilizing transposase RayT
MRPRSLCGAGFHAVSQRFACVTAAGAVHDRDMRFRQSSTKWCHVTLSTYRRRKLFKIAATARFCERLLRTACEGKGWRAEAVAVRPSTVQVLLQVPRATPRDVVVQHLKQAAVDAVRDGMVCPGGRRIFETGHWFAVLPNAAGVAAVRRRLVACAAEPWSGPEAGLGLNMPTAGGPP